jgi:hypothetical protein
MERSCAVKVSYFDKTIWERGARKYTGVNSIPYISSSFISIAKSWRWLRVLMRTAPRHLMISCFNWQSLNTLPIWSQSIKKILIRPPLANHAHPPTLDQVLRKNKWIGNYRQPSQSTLPVDDDFPSSQYLGSSNPSRWNITWQRICDRSGPWVLCRKGWSWPFITWREFAVTSPGPLGTTALNAFSTLNLIWLVCRSETLSLHVECNNQQQTIIIHVISEKSSALKVPRSYEACFSLINRQLFP